MVRLIPEWKRVLNRASSIQLAVLSALLSGAEVALPLLQGMFETSLPRGVFAILSFTTTVLAVLARLAAQPKMRNDAR